MPKPTTLETLRLALELLKRIPRGRKVSAPDLHKDLLAAGFTRDLRTIQRLLDELSGHFDIEKDERSRPFGYQWKATARGLSVPGLNEKESLLLALAERHLETLLPLEVTRALQPFFEQARMNLLPVPDRPAGARAAREWMKKVRVVSTTQPLLPPKIDTGVFEAVTSALYADHWLDLEYRNAAGVSVSAKVMPLGLAQQGTRLYLVCQFDGFTDYRNLALNRIRKAQDTRQHFTRPANFDLQKFDAEGRFGFGSGKTIRLEFLIERMAGVHLLESRLSADQEVSEEGQRLRIKATVAESEQLLWWLRGFGRSVKVIGPASLLQRL